MAKTRKRLVMDLKPDDVILLDRPEVEVLEITAAKKKFRSAPSGAQVLKIRDKHTGKEDEIFCLEDDKLDTLPRKTVWERLKKWLDANHKKYNKKKPNPLLPPIMTVTK